MFHLLDHKTIQTIRNLRIDYFTAGSEYNRLFEKLYEALQKYAEHPKADRYTIAERNETLKGLAEFFNASENLLLQLAAIFEDTGAVYSQNESDHIRALNDDILNYLFERRSEAIKNNNKPRFEIICKAIVNHIATNDCLNYLETIPPNVVPEIIEMDGVKFVMRDNPNNKISNDQNDKI